MNWKPEDLAPLKALHNLGVSLQALAFAHGVEPQVMKGLLNSVKGDARQDGGEMGQRLAKVKFELACIEDSPNPDSRSDLARERDQSRLRELRAELDRLEPVDLKAKNGAVTLSERRTAASTRTVSSAVSLIPIMVSSTPLDSSRPHDDAEVSETSLCPRRQ
jgi:hypothetical protein